MWRGAYLEAGVVLGVGVLVAGDAVVDDVLDPLLPGLDALDLPVQGRQLAEEHLAAGALLVQLGLAARHLEAQRLQLDLHGRAHRRHLGAQAVNLIRPTEEIASVSVYEREWRMVRASLTCARLSLSPLEETCSDSLSSVSRRDSELGLRCDEMTGRAVESEPSMMPHAFL